MQSTYIDAKNKQGEICATLLWCGLAIWTLWCGCGCWQLAHIYKYLNKTEADSSNVWFVLNVALNAHIRCANPFLGPQSLKKSKADVFFALTSPFSAPLRLDSVSKDNHRFEELGCSDMWEEAVGGELLEEISFWKLCSGDFPVALWILLVFKSWDQLLKNICIVKFSFCDICGNYIWSVCRMYSQLRCWSNTALFVICSCCWQIEYTLQYY